MEGRRRGGLRRAEEEEEDFFDYCDTDLQGHAMRMMNFFVVGGFYSEDNIDKEVTMCHVFGAYM